MVSIHQILLQQGRQLWQVENAQRVEAEHTDKFADKSGHRSKPQHPHLWKSESDTNIVN